MLALRGVMLALRGPNARREQKNGRADALVWIHTSSDLGRAHFRDLRSSLVVIPRAPCTAHKRPLGASLYVNGPGHGHPVPAANPCVVRDQCQVGARMSPSTKVGAATSFVPQRCWRGSTVR